MQASAGDAAVFSTLNLLANQASENSPVKQRVKSGLLTIQDHDNEALNEYAYQDPGVR